MRKLERLQLINASARYELLSANHQLIDFHLNRVMKAKQKEKSGSMPQGGVRAKGRLDIANDTIGEVNEQEESNDRDASDLPRQDSITAREIPTNLSLLTDEKSRVNNLNAYGKSANTPAKPSTSGLATDLDKRIQQMQFPHQVMQQ